VQNLKNCYNIFFYLLKIVILYIRALGFNLDPEIELEKRIAELAATEIKNATDHLNQIREETKT
jgi:hypothetical protein